MIRGYRVWDNQEKTYSDKAFSIDQLGICYVQDEDGYWEEIDDSRFIVEFETGLTDKNGKEIYEGDIVKNIEGVNETAVCVWDEGNAEFDFRCKNGKYTRDNIKSWLEMYEVIGNIHEDKELLDGSD